MCCEGCGDSRQCSSNLPVPTIHKNSYQPSAISRRSIRAPSRGSGRADHFARITQGLRPELLLWRAFGARAQPRSTRLAGHYTPNCCK